MVVDGRCAPGGRRAPRGAARGPGAPRRRRSRGDADIVPRDGRLRDHAAAGGESDADTVAIGVFEGERGARPSAPREVGELLASRRGAALVQGARRRRTPTAGAGSWSGSGQRERLRPRARACRGGGGRRARAGDLHAHALLGAPRRSDAAVAGALVEGTILRDYRYERSKSAPAADPDAGAGAARAPDRLVRRTSSQRAVAEAALVARRRQPRARPAEPARQRPRPRRRSANTRGRSRPRSTACGRGRGTRGDRSRAAWARSRRSRRAPSRSRR